MSKFVYGGIHAWPELMCLAVAWIILPAIPLAAEDTVFELDPAQTEIRFTSGVTRHGKFKFKRGTIRIDPGTRWAGGELVIDTTSIDDASRHSGRHSEAVFIPYRVDGTLGSDGHSMIDLHGFLSYEGAAQEVSLPFQVQITGNQITVTTRFTVPQAKWRGLNLNKSADLDIEMDASGRVAFGAPEEIVQSPGARR